MHSHSAPSVPDAFADASVGRLSARHHRELQRQEVKQQMAYEGLESARRAAGVARIVIGLHLATLQDTGGWRGRSGAQSFRRFLLEEGIEPKAAYQYMTVARAFLLEHAVAPERIATVSMRLLVLAAGYLSADDEDAGGESNVEEIIAIVTSMPSAEAVERLRERFELNDAARESLAKARVSRPVANILSSVDGLTHEGRAELYQALRVLPGATPGPVASHAQPRVHRREPVIAPEPPPHFPA